ncbi:MAG TPA: DUF2971 domain-containing protein [Syntrophorhabdaceae bacterium]|nr:DUF2971 domain-containing protein [Syntrophorhabdaceae bacterium]
MYHYTSADGMSGIIDRHEIWMSNTAFMNDTTELKMLQNAKTIFNDNDFANEAVRHEWHEMLERQQFNANRQTDYYMASFSRKTDSLEQWRAYGNFCIGFDAKKLAVKKRVFLYSCLYTENDIRRWLLKKEKMHKWKELEDDEEKRIGAYSLFDVASMKHKNEHFRNEREVRLITVSNHNWLYNNSPEMYEDDLPIHFRRHSVYGFPVPYVKFFIEHESNENTRRMKETEKEMKERKRKEEGIKLRELLPITEVIVGPILLAKFFYRSEATRT